MFRKSIVFAILSLIAVKSVAQVSSDCVDAIPICNNTPVNGGANGYGDDDFSGVTSSGCLERTTTGSIESNSAWYRFRTGATGQLGINIGHDPNEDWDFALYLADNCSNLGTPVRCNFFDNSDTTSYTGFGEDPTGDVANVQYDSWLQVEPGQDYYLFVNNFSNQNSGFSLQFSGEIFQTNPTNALDCSIITNLLGPPVTACQGETVTLNAATANASAYEWYVDAGNGFELINGETSSVLQATTNGNYRVRVFTPTETIISDVQVYFSEVPFTNPISDTAYCLTEENSSYDLSTFDALALGNQQEDSFMVSYYLSETDANAAINPLDKTFVQLPGVDTIWVRVTSIANPLCFNVSQSFELMATSVANLDFPERVLICSGGSVVIGEENPTADYDYVWDTGETTASLTVQQDGFYTLTATPIASSGLCAVSRTVEVVNSIPPTIASIDIVDFSTNNTVTINVNEVGDFEFQLDDGPFQPSNVFSNVVAGEHLVTVRDVNGCDSFTDTIVVAGFVNNFSPNGDVLSETWRIEGLETLAEPQVLIFDRYGKLLKELDSPNDSWDGTFNGKPMPPTDYWFKLSYLNTQGNRVEAKYIQSHFALVR